jgi:hypothetical protein
MYNEAMERIWHPDVMRGISRAIMYKENDKNSDITPKKIIKHKTMPTTEKKDWKKSNEKKDYQAVRKPYLLQKK